MTCCIQDSCSPLLFPPSTHTHARTHTHNSLENNTSFLADSRVRSFGSLLWTNFEIDSLIFFLLIFCMMSGVHNNSKLKQSDFGGKTPQKCLKSRSLKTFLKNGIIYFGWKWLKMKDLKIKCPLSSIENFQLLEF